MLDVDEIRSGLAAFSEEQREILAFLAEGERSQHEFDSHFGVRAKVAPARVRTYDSETFLPPLSAIGSRFYLWVMQHMMQVGDVSAREDENGVVHYRLAAPR